MKVWYLRDKNKRPVACVASNLNPTEETVEFAVSTHNPIDPFKRSIGRELAIGRLYSGVTQSVEMGPGVMTRIMDVIRSEPWQYPQRARDAAWLWLRDQAERNADPWPMRQRIR